MNNSILIIDVDSQIPNIALMKISTFYKQQNYKIKFLKLNYSYYKVNKKRIINSKNFYKVFASIIFNINKDVLIFNEESNVSVGGSGFDLNIKLSKEIDEIKNYDYSLYNESKTSYGFISRGCIRKCKFCIVPQKEGNIYQENKIEDIYKFKQIKFLDNNFLALKNHKEILKELINKNIKFQFNQGLDIRLLDDENAELLSKCNYLNEFIFAFDDIKYYDLINEKYKLFKTYFSKDWKCKFFIYVHPNMNFINEILPRINWCKENKVLPYLMRDISCYKSKNKNFYTDISSYCNQPSLFKTHTFEEYLQKRLKHYYRINHSLKIYKGIINV